MADPFRRDAVVEQDWSALEAVAVPIAVVDDTGHTRYLNRRWREVDPGDGFAIGARYDACTAATLGEGCEDGALLDEGLSLDQAVSGAPMRTPDGQSIRRTEICPLTTPNGRFLLVHKHDLTAEGEAGEVLLRHAALLEALGFAAAQFLSSLDWASSVDLALSRLGEAADMSRASLFVAERAADNGLRFLRTNVWNNSAGAELDLPGPNILDPRALGVPHWLEALLHDDIVYLHTGETSAAEQKILDVHGIASIIALPIRVDGQPWGLLTGAYEKRRSFDAAEAGALRAASRLIGASIAHGQARAVIDRTRAQEEQLRAQRETLLELQTPLIPLFDDILVLPLIGKLERERVARMLERLLHGIVANRARIVIIDVTGVPQIEPDVAAALAGAAQAVGLLGARVLLTGINPTVASSLVAVDSELRHLQTFGTLERALVASMRSDRRRAR